MGEILAFKKPKPAARHKGKTLCRHGFHKWEIQQAQQFDSKQGRLVTLYKCARCGKLKNEAI
jgi:hypothetical protein